MKQVAVVGSGLAGLSVAHLLSKSKNHRVTIFESSSTCGLDVASVSVEDKENNEVRIDVPMRSINKAYYPTLFKLFKHIGVQERQGGYETAWSEWKGNSSKENPNTTYFNAFRPRTENWRCYYALIDPFCKPLTTLYFTFEFIRLFLHTVYYSYTNGFHLIHGTFGEYLEKHHFGGDFVTKFLLPFLTGMGTCSSDAMLEYPARVIMHMTSLFGTEFFQTKGGVRTVCEKLLSNVSNVNYNCAVVGVWHLKDENKVILQDSMGRFHTFDHVIFSTQAKIAKNILTANPPTELQNRVSTPDATLLTSLETFPYEPVKVIVHTEESIMPQDRKLWRGINITCDGKEAMATLWINYTQDLPKGTKDFFESSSIFVKPEPIIPKEKILGQYTFPRSFVTEESCAGLDELERLQGKNQISFVGSWAWPGMPLLEGCVASAVRCSERLGLERPWVPEGYEALPWSPADDTLETGIVERFLRNELVANKDQKLSLFSKLYNQIMIYYIGLFMWSTTTLIGLTVFNKKKLN
ncbi:hypothetical protein HK103_006192 [Boothiomyces macroporosus]|uniref:Amine oxidase domain-containing protein n=1 Tax=Boothiomyces macroporosus TaxID=261099 RepID=A0AAD5UH74_9FUNG|nr:hypothetical protein HK103_006192 [Boothiomyces macroporosus]